MKKILLPALIGSAMICMVGCAGSKQTTNASQQATSSPSFTITFVLNDETETVLGKKQTAPDGTLAQSEWLDAKGLRKGYDFVGWYVKTNGNLYGMMPFQSHPLVGPDTVFTEDTEVCAAWQVQIAFVETTADNGSTVTLGITPNTKLIDKDGTPVDPLIYFRNPGVQRADRTLFKDLSGNGRLDPYEDWRLPVAERVADLASRLAADSNGIEKMAGLMLYSSHQMVLDPYIGDLQKDFLTNDHLRHILVMQVNNPVDGSRWANNVQAYLEGLNADFGIPANNSSDPRHGAGSVSSAEYSSYTGGISAWPSSLGIAATFNPQVMLKFGQIASAEYRLMGIATALSPQIDIATDPRWSRFNGTFGEDPRLAADMTSAYVRGFQSNYVLNSNGSFTGESGWGIYSVNAMIKHWPGGGAGEGGQDAHYKYGKYAVYPGGNFNAHLIPFVDGAFNRTNVGPTQKAMAVMPYYTISYLQVPGSEPNSSQSPFAHLNMANAYSSYIITNLLRGAYQFNGVVCTDWNVVGPSESPEASMFGPTPGMIWGVDDHYPDYSGFTARDRQHRADMLLRAGVNQFGGLNTIAPIVDAYNANKAEIEPFIIESTKALLTNIFNPGLFENPYIDISAAEKLIGNATFVTEGYQAQLDSMVLLKNKGAVLPLKSGVTVYIPGAAPTRSTEATVDAALVDLLKSYFGSDHVITDSARAGTADVALIFGSSLISGGGSYNADGSINYKPANLSYAPYTATNARAVSIAGVPIRDAAGTVTGRENNSYKGKTADPFDAIPGFFGSSPSTLPNFLEDLNLAKASNKPVILSLSLSNPMVLKDIEADIDAILVDFENQKAAILDMLVGATKNGAPAGRTLTIAPKGLLPMQMPRDMETVEAQYEDVPRDMIPYTDAVGNVWDFGFGLSYGTSAPLTIPSAYNQSAQKEPNNVGIGEYSILNRKKVAFDYDGDGKADFVKIVHAGNPVTDIVDPISARGGYTLSGWNKDGQPYNFNTPVTEDILLTARWVAN
ncbi:MAG: glycoside hydrolase family 3 C-terminal domain-containing protein [Treponema sp.]|jgi:beta-glucosidase|nr:glycoside hydrolase family 3 C-terminal domain-containing protein [Treponema sp.]